MLIDALTSLIAPRVCRICGCSLNSGEQVMCLACELALPRTRVHLQPFNTIHQRLGHHCKVDRAAGWFTYRRGTDYARLLVDAKYSDLPRIAMIMGRKCAAELQADAFFAGIDVLIPMPMHWRKRLLRGYNQAVEICRGIGEVTALPVVEALRAVRSHGVQSRHNRTRRFSSIADTMALAKDADIAGRHVLLVDDIITSGASLQEAVRALSTGAPASVSILTLGLTQLD